MVNITSLTGLGLKDWLIQRVSAVYLSLYILFLLGYFTLYQSLTYSTWAGLFRNNSFKIASLLTLVMIFLHTWIGIWTVTTDYIKGTAVRLLVQMLVVIFLMSQFIWGVMIVWGQ